MSDELPSAKALAGNGHRRPRHRSRRKSGRKGKSRSNVFGAVDLGTNNCRLLVAKPSGEGFRVIDSYSRVVRLGAGLSSTGQLSQKSMDAAVEAIKVCSDKMRIKKVQRWRCIATQACRQAGNGEEFLERVKTETGLTFELISPRVEARLAVMGCLSLIDKSKDVALVVDIGGGSSELSWVDVRKLRDSSASHRVHRPPISAWASLPAGVVTLSEAFPEQGQTRADLDARYTAMKDHVRSLIVDAGCETRFTKAFSEGKGHMVGTSGTITSLAGIHLKLPYYQRDKVDGLWMQSADAVRIAQHMASLPVDLRAQEPCIGADRASLLVAGCAIMDVLCELWPAKRIRVADRGLREGMLMGLMKGTAQSRPASQTAEQATSEPPTSQQPISGPES